MLWVVIVKVFGDEVVVCMCIFYGGLVKVVNIVSFMCEFDVDGVLVGGVSFVVDEFVVIICFEKYVGV